MFFPQAMLRLVWFVPKERLVSSIQLLSQTAAFHPGERFLLGEAQDLAPLKQSLRARQRYQRQLAARRLLEPLPGDTLLSYRTGELGRQSSLPEGCIHGDEIYLWVGTKPASDLEEQWSPAPPVQSPCPDLINKLSDSQCQLLFATEDQVSHIAHWCIIDGWIPAAKAPLFLNLLHKEAFVLTSAEECELPLEKVPSLLTRPRPLEGFAALMGLYGTTTYRELDPTPILAVGFTLMFGMMFADLGQGLLLFLVGLGFYSRYFSFVSQQTAHRLGCLLMPVGLSAGFFGTLFGSAFAHEDWIPALLFHPMDHVLGYLTASVMIGVVLLTIGMALGAFNAWRSQRLNAVLWDNFGPLGLVFYLSLIICGAGQLGDWPLLRSVGVAMAMIGLLLMAAHYFADMDKEPLGLRLFATVLETYDFAIKFAIQTLSFVRIAAFTFAHIALSTAVIISVDLLADQTVLAWTALIVGNLLITLIEGVLVSIQAIRLHFFELFTKFVTGGGIAFSPLVTSKEGEDEYNRLLQATTVR